MIANLEAAQERIQRFLESDPPVRRSRFGVKTTPDAPSERQRQAHEGTARLARCASAARDVDDVADAALALTDVVEEAGQRVDVVLSGARSLRGWTAVVFGGCSLGWCSPP